VAPVVAARVGAPSLGGGGLVVRGLRVWRGGRLVVRGASFRAPAGVVTAVIGPNGAGKSSLLMGLAGLAPARGEVLLGGVELLGLPPGERARLLSYASPDPLPRGLGQRVWEFVAASLYPVSPPGLGLPPGGREAALRVLRLLGAEGLADWRLLETSSGEAQRALVAHALARGAPVVVLDEPTSFQDIRGRLLVYRSLARYAEERGAVVLVATHDFVLAALHAGHVVAVEGGRVVAEGASGEVLQPELLERLYGVKVAERPVPVPVEPL
jgi:iron complex transport system ATP-binding protein